MTLKATLFTFLITLLISSCQGDSKAVVKKMTAQELRDQLSKLESLDSIQYVSVRLINFEENLVMVRARGLFRAPQYKVDGWNVIGEITNTALLATYKDVVLTISYFSKTKSLIDKKEIVVYEYLKPNSSISFNSKVNPPDGTYKIDLTVKSMTPIQR